MRASQSRWRQWQGPPASVRCAFPRWRGIHVLFIEGKTLDSAPDLSGLAPEIVERVRGGSHPDGRVTVTVQGDIPDELELRIVATMTAERREGVRAAVHRHRSREGSVTLVGTNPVGPVQKLMRLRRFGMLRAED